MHPPVLALYLAATGSGLRSVERRLERRVTRGREDPSRIGERHGQASLPRPEGPLLWFHASGPADLYVVRELVRRLRRDRDELQVLVTTVAPMTVKGSADPSLRNVAFHQLAPLDLRTSVQRFLDHWQPDTAVWIGDAIWPRLVLATSVRQVPMLWICASMARTAYRRARLMRRSMRTVLSRFDRVFAEDAGTGAMLRRLGLGKPRLEVSGPLEFGGGVLPFSEKMRQQLAQPVGQRPVWLAVGVTPGEAGLALSAQAAIQRKNHRALLILMPDQPEHTDRMMKLAQEARLRATLRSEDEIPGEFTQVLIADRPDELGLWYRLAPVALLGQSLDPAGGIDPFAAAAAGTAIIHGPEVGDHRAAYELLRAEDATTLVRDQRELMNAVSDLLGPARAASQAGRAWAVMTRGAEATDRLIGLLEDALDLGRLVPEDAA